VSEECGDEVGGERDCIAVFEQERETLLELNDKAGAELAWELDFDEAGVSAFQRLRRAGVGTRHGGQCGRLKRSR
jgi:hypothetical protein